MKLFAALGWTVKVLILCLVLGTAVLLNPEDPNVCSHWERYCNALQKQLRLLSISQTREIHVLRVLV